VATALRKLEAKLCFVVFGWAMAKLHLVVVAVQSLAGLEQVAVVTTGLGSSSLERAMARLNTGDFEWATAGLRKLEVWMVVTRAATAMAAVVKVVVVMVSKAMAMAECCLQGERVHGQRNSKLDMARVRSRQARLSSASQVRVAREFGQETRVLAGLGGHGLASAVERLARVQVKAWAWALLGGHLGKGGHIVYTRLCRWGRRWTDSTCL